MDGWMGGWIHQWMGGWMDGWMDGWINQWMDGWINESDELVDRYWSPQRVRDGDFAGGFVDAGPNPTSQVKRGSFCGRGGWY